MSEDIGKKCNVAAPKGRSQANVRYEANCEEVASVRFWPKAARQR